MSSVTTFYSQSACAGILAGYRPRARGKTGREMFEELASLSPAGEFRMEDACNADPGELEEFCRLVGGTRGRPVIRARAVVAPALDARLLQAMKKAGFVKVTFDAVSASARLLEELRLGFSPADLSAALERCRDAGIAAGVRLLVGHPCESDGDFVQTVQFIRGHAPLIGSIEAVYCFCRGEFSYLADSPCPRDCRCAPPAGRRAVSYERMLKELTCPDIPIAVCPPPGCFLTEVERAEQGLLKGQTCSFRFSDGTLLAYGSAGQLTGGWGIYSSLFADASWHDSRGLADWKILEKAPGRMVLEAVWKTLPMSQIWDARLEGNRLELDIAMKVKEPFFISGERQVNVMLFPQYTDWESGGEKGKYAPDFTPDWVTLFSREAQGKDSITASGPGLPPVTLHCGKGMLVSALNTSAALGMRILKCHTEEPLACEPGTYGYFRGAVTLEES